MAKEIIFNRMRLLKTIETDSHIYTKFVFNMEIKNRETGINNDQIICCKTPIESFHPSYYPRAEHKISIEEFIQSQWFEENIP